jgi:hypothetical protein
MMGASFAHYRVIAKLGDVWRATDTRLDRAVALEPTTAVMLTPDSSERSA